MWLGHRLSWASRPGSPLVPDLWAQGHKVHPGCIHSTGVRRQSQAARVTGHRAGDQLGRGAWEDWQMVGCLRKVYATVLGEGSRQRLSRTSFLGQGEERKHAEGNV